VRRFRIEVKSDGGHSWGDFGAPSAVHEICQLVARLAELPVPDEPKTTFNVGVIAGGTVINAIASEAHCLLDLRSVDHQALDLLAAEVERVVAEARRPGAEATMQQIGARPAGQLARESPLVAWAAEALRQVGTPNVAYIAGSTDANVPLGRGWPAVCIGLATSGNTHRLDEYLDPERLPQGLGQLLLLTLAAAGFPAASSDPGG
jgi:acetylornithine deacetylase/succinyl-diaminopimelate desuccinylase-like protein